LQWALLGKGEVRKSRDLEKLTQIDRFAHGLTRLVVVQLTLPLEQLLAFSVSREFLFQLNFESSRVIDCTLNSFCAHCSSTLTVVFLGGHTASGLDWEVWALLFLGQKGSLNSDTEYADGFQSCQSNVRKFKLVLPNVK
jgi:hypothetical protein